MGGVFFYPLVLVLVLSGLIQVMRGEGREGGGFNTPQNNQVVGEKATVIISHAK